MEKVLFLDACIREEGSRTKQLCNTYLEEFKKYHPEAEVETVVLRDGTVKTHTMEKLNVRDSYARNKDWSHPMFDLGKQYRDADYIVIGTPYWDLSFAAILKVYIENIMVADLTFGCNDTGFYGLCNGKKMVYITTGGGKIEGQNFGYDYMCAIAEMTGIDETECFTAECLDIVGFDADAIMEEAKAEIKKRLCAENK
ncbi:MAG: NAD(P)H-dependent oxidoreductase [Firmicutes bacterium]|nr:NAD(P)H-dependent oxidoreductase [Bacillota bacterium]